MTITRTIIRVQPMAVRIARTSGESTSGGEIIQSPQPYEERTVASFRFGDGAGNIVFRFGEGGGEVRW